MIRKIILSILIACILCTSVFASSTTFDITAYKKKTTLNTADDVQLQIFDAISTSLNTIYDSAVSPTPSDINITDHVPSLLGDITEIGNIYQYGKRAVFSYEIYGRGTNTYKISFSFGAGFKNESESKTIPAAIALNNYKYDFTGVKNGENGVSNYEVDIINRASSFKQTLGTSGTDIYLIKHISDNSQANLYLGAKSVEAEFSITKNGATGAIFELPDNTLWVAQGSVSLIIEIEDYKTAPAGTYKVPVTVKLEVMS